MGGPNTAACILAPRDRYTLRKRPSSLPSFFLRAAYDYRVVDAMVRETLSKRFRSEEPTKHHESKDGEFNKGFESGTRSMERAGALMRPRFKLVIPRKSH